MPAPCAFDYAVVRVVPRVERGEFLNAGVIVWCLAQDFLAARVALDVTRLRALDPGADVDAISAHLAAVPRICAGDPTAGPVARLPAKERFHWLVAPLQHRDPDFSGPRGPRGDAGGGTRPSLQDPGGVRTVRRLTPAPARVFLLSPARCDGVRMMMLRRAAASFPLALELRSAAGATLGDVFTFTSGLYFRGKITYARAFGPSWVITPGAGLVEPDRRITPSELDAWARVRVDLEDRRYRRPLERDARALSGRFPEAEVVLLGSIASDKYVDLLLDIFDERLLFPVDFVGRGDMSRGGLLLRSARAGTELSYGPVRGAVRHGPRPPRLPRLQPRPLPERRGVRAAKIVSASKIKRMTDLE